MDGFLGREVERDDGIFRGGGCRHRHGQVLLEEQTQRLLHLTAYAAAYLVAQQRVLVLGHEFQLHRRTGNDAFGVVVQEHDGSVRYALAPRVAQVQVVEAPQDRRLDAARGWVGRIDLEQGECQELAGIQLPLLDVRLRSHFPGEGIARLRAMPRVRAVEGGPNGLAGRARVMTLRVQPVLALVGQRLGNGRNDNLQVQVDSIEHRLGGALNPQVTLDDTGYLLEGATHLAMSGGVNVVVRLDDQRAATSVGDPADEGDVFGGPVVAIDHQGCFLHVHGHSAFVLGTMSFPRSSRVLLQDTVSFPCDTHLIP